MSGVTSAGSTENTRAPDEAVQVFAGVERLDEPRVAREVRHDAHLDLRVVGGEQLGVLGSVTERLADAAALGRADRDVLQVRVVRRHAAGRGADLPVGGVDAPVGGDRLVERLDDLAELRGVAVLEQVAEERVRVRLLQVGERARVGRVAGLRRTRLRHAELVEEHLLELLRGTEVHLTADLGERRAAASPAARSPSSDESAASSA